MKLISIKQITDIFASYNPNSEVAAVKDKIIFFTNLTPTLIFAEDLEELYKLGVKWEDGTFLVNTKPDFSRVKLTFEEFTLTDEEAKEAVKNGKKFVTDGFDPIPFVE